jgi:hypothetical protein
MRVKKKKNRYPGWLSLLDFKKYEDHGICPACGNSKIKTVLYGDLKDTI